MEKPAQLRAILLSCNVNDNNNMKIFKNQLKKILGLFSIVFLLAGIGILTKENNQKVSQKNGSNSLVVESQDQSNLNEKSEIKCADVLEEDENSLVFREYNEKAVECMFVGCGGIF